MRTLLLLCALGLVSGCTYQRFTFDQGMTYADLAAVMPRAPLRLAYRSAQPDAGDSDWILHTLKKHPLVVLVPEKDADVIVDFRSSDCDNNTVMFDSFIGAWTMTALLPLTLFANPFPTHSWNCDIKVGFALQKLPARQGNADFRFRYTGKQYSQVFLYPVFATKARARYHREYLYDQMTARLLLAIQKEMRGEVW